MAPSMDVRRHVALVFPATLELGHLHKDPGLIAAGLGDLPIFCANDRTGRANVVVAAEGQMSDPLFWRRQGVTHAILYTWLRRAEVVTALKQAGARVVVKADSDGLIDPRRHPIAQFKRMVLPPGRPIERTKRAWHLAKRIGPLHRHETADITAGFLAADGLIFENGAAAEEFRAFLLRQGVETAATPIHVIANPVAGPFVEQSVPERPDMTMAAVGRWDDPQKNASGLLRALRAALERRSDWRAVVVGPGGEEVFTGRHPRLDYRGTLSHGELAALLASASILVSSSRWEGTPLSALEGLACGCSLVGPPLPAFRSLIGAGEFGYVARRGTTRALAAALDMEQQAWEAGSRSSPDIAAHWRDRVATGAVARRIGTSLDLL